MRLLRLVYSDRLMAEFRAQGYARPGSPGVRDMRAAHRRLVLPSPVGIGPQAKLAVARGLAALGFIDLEEDP